MLKSIMPLILVILAGAIFFGYIKDQLAVTSVLAANRAEFSKALDQYDALVAIKGQKEQERSQISDTNLKQLSKIVPDNVDNIRLFLDMQGIASRHGIGISNIRVGDSSTASQSGQQAIGPSDSNRGVITLSFGTVAKYESLISFLEDVQRSLRIVEIKSLDFKVGAQPNSYQVSIGINTFWIKGTNSIVINQ